MLLGSTSIKAVRRILMKLSPEAHLGRCSEFSIDAQNPPPNVIVGIIGTGQLAAFNDEINVSTY